jgi:hypothetical protein
MDWDVLGLFSLIVTIGDVLLEVFLELLLDLFLEVGDDVREKVDPCCDIVGDKDAEVEDVEFIAV